MLLIKETKAANRKKKTIKTHTSCQNGINNDVVVEIIHRIFALTGGLYLFATLNMFMEIRRRKVKSSIF